jgi:hypothetical protein
VASLAHQGAVQPIRNIKVPIDQQHLAEHWPDVGSYLSERGIHVPAVRFAVGNKRIVQPVGFRLVNHKPEFFESCEDRREPLVVLHGRHLGVAARVLRC